VVRRAGRGLVAIVIAAGLGLAALMLIPALLGLQRYVITGDSMTGSYDRGSIVFEREVPSSDLTVGDVITYRPPRGEGPDGLVTHRIVAIRDGGRVFRTEGDANPRPDPWRFELHAPTQARVAFSVPYAGFALAALGIRDVRMLVIGLPALLVALAAITRLWREAGEEARRRAAAGALER
jgi:signal peptidase